MPKDVILTPEGLANLKSELEVAQLHRKLDHLTERFEAATARGKHLVGERSSGLVG